MVNTVILGDCLYKKSSVLSTLQNYCFSGIYASTQNSHFCGTCGNKVFLSRDALALNSD